MFAGSTSLDFVALEIYVSEYITIQYVKMSTVMLESVLSDIPENANSIWSSKDASLEATAGLVIVSKTSLKQYKNLKV